MCRVAIVKDVDPIEITVRALEMIKSDLKDVLSMNQPFLIKPNYLNSKHPSTGITTDCRVVEGIVKFLRKNNVDKIIIGEGSGFADTFQAFKVAGLDEVAERWNVELVDLNKDNFIEVTPLDPISLKKVKVAKTVLESVIVSVPKLKLHRIAKVTLSLKNMMGALASKGSMHRGRLNSNIVDLASVLKPSISVVDGVIAGEGHESSGNPVEMNLVIAGTDPVAVDSVGAAVMGVPPSDVKHLILAEKKGLGTCDLEKIIVLGSQIEDVKRKFKRAFSSRFLSHIG